MANYLDYLYQMQGIQPGLLGGGASNSAAQMLQNGAANTQALMQANDRIKAQMAQDEAAAAQGLQKANADEQARKQKIMQLGLMFATGGMGGEAAAGGAGEAATKAMADEAAKNAMANVAGEEFLKQQVANPNSFLYDPLKAYQGGGAFFAPRSGLLWG